MLHIHVTKLVTKYDLSKNDTKTIVYVLNIAQTCTFQYIHSEGILNFCHNREVTKSHPKDDKTKEFLTDRFHKGIAAM